MDARKYSSLQIFRGLAANAVVMAHLAKVEGKYGQGFAILPEWTSFAGWSGVHFFFIISGVVMALIVADTNWRVFIGARLLRIYPIYWIYTSAVLALFLVAPAMVNASYAHPPSILKSYLLLPQDVGPLLAVGWTLIHEMYFYLVMSLILAVSAPLALALTIWAALVIAGTLMLPASIAALPEIAVPFSPLTLEFILGAAIGLMIKRGICAFGYMSLIAGLILVIAGVAIYVASGVDPGNVNASILLLGLPFIFVVYGALAIERRSGWSRLPWLERLGDASYSTYLSHVLVLSALGRAFASGPHGRMIEWVFLVAGLIAANVVGLLSFNYIERPILRLRRLMPRQPVRTPAAN